MHAAPTVSPDIRISLMFLVLFTMSDKRPPFSGAVSTSPPPEVAKPFETDKDFREYFNEYPILMRSQLALYVSKKPRFKELANAIEYRDTFRLYHTNSNNAQSEESLKEDFCSEFKKEHFVQIIHDQESQKYKYPRSIYPQGLFTFNEKEYDKVTSSIDKAAALFKRMGVFNQMKTHRNENQAKMCMEQRQEESSQFIARCF